MKMNKMSFFITLVGFLPLYSCSEFGSNEEISNFNLIQNKSTGQFTLTSGYVRRIIYNNLFNTLGIEACFNENGPVFRTISGAQALEIIANALRLGQGGIIDGDTEVYLRALSDNPNITMAVLIEIPDTNEVYIYVPNNGNFGINLIEDKNDQKSAGLLIRVPSSSGSNQKTTTVVTCQTCQGSYGSGCSCTCSTITVTCIDDEPCICPGGDQCSGSCNRQSDWSQVCPNISPFNDDTNFYDLIPNTYF